MILWISSWLEHHGRGVYVCVYLGTNVSAISFLMIDRPSFHLKVLKEKLLAYTHNPWHSTIFRKDTFQRVPNIVLKVKDKSNRVYYHHKQKNIPVKIIKENKHLQDTQIHRPSWCGSPRQYPWWSWSAIKEKQEGPSLPIKHFPVVDRSPSLASEHLQPWADWVWGIQEGCLILQVVLVEKTQILVETPVWKGVRRIQRVPSFQTVLKLSLCKTQSQWTTQENSMHQIIK